MPFTTWLTSQLRANKRHSRKRDAYRSRVLDRSEWYRFDALEDRTLLAAPVADAGGPYRVQLGENTVLDASLTTHPDEKPSRLTYEWDLDEDGIFGETGSNALNGDEADIHPVFTTDNLNSLDSRTVSLRVIDSQLNVDTATATISVINDVPEIEWAVAMGGNAQDHIEEVKVDQNGNVFLLGYYNADFDADPGSGETLLTYSGDTTSDYDLYVIKLDNAGNFLWANSVSDEDQVYAEHLELDQLGNVYVSGTFSGTIDFDPGSSVAELTSNGEQDVFVFKLNGNGDLVWSKSFGGSNEDYGIGLHVNDDGSFLVSGSFQGTIDFDPGPGTYSVTVDDYASVFVSAFDTDGDFLWTEYFTHGVNDGNAKAYAYDVFQDDSGGVYLAGNFKGTIDFDPGPGVFELTSSFTNSDMFVLKLDSSGELIWAKSMVTLEGGGSIQYPWDIKADSTGNLFIAGGFAGTVDFDPGPDTYSLESIRYRDAFLQKLDVNGNLDWIVAAGSLYPNDAYNLFIDSADDIFVVGIVSESPDFDPGPGVYTMDQGDAFLAKYTNDGVLLWANNLRALHEGLDVDSDGNIYTAGRFLETIDFAPGPDVYQLTSKGSTDIFVRKLVPRSPIIADAGGPYRINIDENTVLDGSATTHPDEDPATLTYEWDLDGDGLFGETGASALNGDETGINPIFKTANFLGAITHTVELRVTDSLLRTNTTSTTVDILDAIPELDWGLGFGGIGYEQAEQIQIDVYGNIYVAGQYRETFDADPGVGVTMLPSSGGRDLFVSKFDTIGNLLWARSFGAPDNIYLEDSGVDEDNNLFFSGSFNGTVDFDPGVGADNRTSNGSSDVFLMKMDENGNLIWVQTFGGEFSDFGDGLYVDNNGHSYLSGAFEGTVDLDPGAGTDLRTAVEVNSYISKFDTQGNLIWARDFTQSENPGGWASELNEVTVDVLGNVYAAGLFNGTLDADPGTGIFEISSPGGGFDLYIVKLDANGDFIWAKTMVSSDNSFTQVPWDIQLDDAGNIYTAGRFSGTTDFDPGPGESNLVSEGQRDAFVQKLDTNGNFEWAVGIGSSNSDRASALAISNAGEVYVTGFTNGPADFDPGAESFILNEGGAYLAKYNTAGELQWATNHPTTGEGIALDYAGNIYQVGRFEGIVDFAPGKDVFELTGKGADAFIRKLGNPTIRTDLGISKSSSVVAVEQGAPHSYTVVASNDGPNESPYSRIKDDPSAFLDNISWTAVVTGGTVATLAGTGPIDELVNLPIGATITYTITGTVKPNVRENITNVATINTAPLFDTDRTNNTAHDSDVIVLAAEGGSGYFVAGSVFGDSDYTSSVNLGDIDGDGDIDAVFANVSGSRIWTNNGGAAFTDTGQILPHANSAALGDLDGDGDLDIYLTRTSTDPDEVWINDGTGTFTNSGQSIGDYQSRWVVLGDFNGDGALDAIVSVYEGVSANRLILNDGNGHFTESAQNIGLTPGADHRGLAAGDLDGDGDLDLFSGKHTWGDDDRVYLNDGTGQFSEHQIINLIGEYTGQVDFGDVDGDGDLDAVVPHGYLSTKLLLNDGTGSFTLGQTLHDEIDESSSAQFGDFDKDGDLDIYIGSAVDSSNSIWLNDGSGYFTDSGQRLGKNSSVFVQLGDLDGDGDLDAIAANYNDQSQVWLNQNITLPYSNDFEEVHWGGLYLKTPQNFSIIEENGNKYLQTDNSGLTGLSTALVATETPLPETFEMSATITSIGGPNRWLDGFLIFDYQNENDFKYAGQFKGQNQWVIGHYQGSWGNKLSVVDWDDSGQQISVNKAYTLHVRVDGDQARLLVDGLFVTSATFAGGIGDGKAGVASYHAVTRFDNFEIAESVATGTPASLPFQENFEDGTADGCYYPLLNNWAVINGDGGKVFRINNSGNTNLGINYVPLPADAPSTFEMSARINSIQAGSGWQNGFLIFDYKSPSDFKYAGMFTGQNQWIIGHYQGDFNNRLAEVDWDDSGRTINSNEFYTVHVRIDGATVWLSADGEVVTSATFSEEVNTGAVGMAAERAFTWFDDFEVGENVAAGAPMNIPYQEDFNDGVANQLAFHLPNLWSVTGPVGNEYLQIDASGNQGLGIGTLNTPYLMPDSYEMSAVVTTIGGTNRWLDGFLIFDYQSPTDFKYAGMFTGVNQWVIGHYQGNWTNRLAQVDLDDVGNQIYASKAYTLHVTVDGNDVELRVDGIPTLSATFASGITNGTVGVAAQNAVTRFDNLHIDLDVPQGKELPLPYSDDFNDGAAQDFYYNLPGAWGIANFGAEKVLRVNTAGSGRTGLAFVPIDSTDAEAIKVSVDVRSNQVTNGWHDAFVIFDYKNENDFKYVGFYTGQNEWVLGHFQGNWNNRFDTLDWDGSGRKINFNQFYHLELHLENGYFIFNVDGEEIFAHSFGSPIAKGAVGVAAANAFSWFDNFTVEETGPRFIPVASPLADPVFANWDEESDDLLI
ncbi:FG-GAP repeat protein [Polystyrenella longa]|uniref:FG-GAP repeat protein n=1 Tax=Polystyrenella longa TaxID=2528007 RepID=A0A518CTQ3_9PLAN|nr:FG-GAP-like repeat-containing protein [Polystyrenella longa]QDU82605.1 FG-GAP repeat protein [Polystyrenella longa]